MLAYSAYAFAEEWGTSGVLAAVAAGLLCGNLTARSMTPTARLAVESFWEFAAFAVNSIVFLLIVGASFENPPSLTETER